MSQMFLMPQIESKHRQAGNGVMVITCALVIKSKWTPGFA
jgi:hypothetical protein